MARLDFWRQRFLKLVAGANEGKGEQELATTLRVFGDVCSLVASLEAS